MANEDQNTGQDPLAYLRIFDEELKAIRFNLEELNSEGGLVPSTLIAMKNQMVKVMGKAYESAGAVTSPGVVTFKSGEIPFPYAAAGPSIPTTSTTPQISGGAVTTPSGAINPQLAAMGIGMSVSPNASVGGEGWASRVNNPPFRLPQYGTLTMQDLMDQPANYMARRSFANLQANPTYQRLAALGQKAQTPTGELTPDAQAMVDELNSGVGGAGGLWGTASDILGGTAKGYEIGKAATQGFHRLFTPAGNMRDLAYLTGYQGANQGFMGFNPGAVAAGLGQRASEMGFAFNNNLTPGQSEGIYNNLFGLGWNGGSSTNAMRQGLASVTQMNPVLGTNPAVAAMMDQAVRNGQNTVAQFVATMKTIPAAADAAHVSLAQMVSDAQNLGNYYVSMGGSALQGQQAASDFATVTGMPSGLFQSLLQNPLVQGQVMMNSGYIPGMQGLASTSNQLQGVFSTLNMLRGAMHFAARPSVDAFGVKHTVTGQTQDYGWMSHILQSMGTDISAAQIKHMMLNQTGIQTGERVLTDASNYQNDVKSGALHTNGRGWNSLWQDINNSKDWKGDPLFSKKQKEAILKAGATADPTSLASQQKIIDYMNRHSPTTTRKGALGWSTKESWEDRETARYDSTHHGATNYGPSDSYLTRQAMESGMIPKSLQGLRKGQKSVAAARAAAIRTALDQNTRRSGNAAQSGSGVTISLSGAAAKMFKLSSNTGSAKNNAGAGNATSVNVPYAGSGTGSDPLYANPNTSDANNNTSWGSTTNAPNTF